MRRTAFWTIALCFLLIQRRAFGADETILLEQSQIVGGAPKEGSREGKPTERPALSTALPWGAEREENNLNIAEEILHRLAEPDPSYLSGESFESPDVESLQGE